MRHEGGDVRQVARTARYVRGGCLPQAARHYGRLPAVTHDIALHAMSLRDYKMLPCNHYELCIMNYALNEAHSWDSVTALRF